MSSSHSLPLPSFHRPTRLAGGLLRHAWPLCRKTGNPVAVRRLDEASLLANNRPPATGAFPFGLSQELSAMSIFPRVPPPICVAYIGELRACGQLQVIGRAALTRRRGRRPRLQLVKPHWKAVDLVSAAYPMLTRDVWST